MSIPLFKDFGKPAKDLINKNYPMNKSVTLKTAADNGVELETKLCKSDGITGSFTPKFSVPKYGVVIEQTVNHKDLVHGEVTITDKIGKGTKVTVGHVCGGNKPEVSFGVEYRHEKASVAAGVVYPIQDKAPVVSFSAVAGKPCLGAGFSVVALANKGEVANIDVGAYYSKGRYSLASVSKVKQPDASAGVSTELMAHCKVDAKLAVATGVSFSSVSKSGSPCDQVSVVAGGSYMPDSQTTLRARLSSCGHLRMAWTNQINSRTKLTMAADFETVSEPKGKLGFELALNA